MDFLSSKRKVIQIIIQLIIKSCTISKTASGRYYISILVDTENFALPNVDKKIGVDVGLKEFAICSDGYNIFMYSPAPHKDFPKEKIPFYGAYMRKLFGALTEGKEVFIQVRIPTEENAMAEGIDYEVYKEAMYNALNIN